MLAVIIYSDAHGNPIVDKEFDFVEDAIKYAEEKWNDMFDYQKEQFDLAVAEGVDEYNIDRTYWMNGKRKERYIVREEGGMDTLETFFETKEEAIDYAEMLYKHLTSAEKKSESILAGLTNDDYGMEDMYDNIVCDIVEVYFDSEDME